ncbi:MAG: symmetrical bis(5'-nucleosyl)-tetraphosphatase [Steroidobacteraceae bacterium]
MAVYAIGDIQGCCDEFELLLTRLQFDPQQDRLWLTGDLVNRGPRSLDTLRLVKSLGGAAITVLGNHDLHLLAIALDPEAKRKSKDTLDDILTAPDRDELLHWLRHQPLLHHDADLNLTMIHAGLPPQWDLPQAIACAREVETALRDPQQAVALFQHMYGDDPDRWSDDLQGFSRLRFITNCLTRLRACTENGKLKLKAKGAPDQLESGLYPWFRVPKRRSGNERIIFGHWSALGFHNGDNVLALDTGCVWGGQLCATAIDRPDAKPVLVESISGGLPIEE